MRLAKQLAALQILLVCLSTVSAVSEDLCDRNGDLMPILGIDGRAFCQTTGITAQNLEKCLLLDLAAKAFSKVQGQQQMGVMNAISVLACRATRQVSHATHALDGKSCLCLAAACLCLS